jgi:hypothetical protein
MTGDSKTCFRFVSPTELENMPEMLDNGPAKWTDVGRYMGGDDVKFWQPEALTDPKIWAAERHLQWI